MKIYMGLPGEPAVISVTDNRTGRTWMLEGDFGWGKAGGMGQAPREAAFALKARNTAIAILKDYRDEATAIRFHSRFLWRVVASWRPTVPWTYTGAEIAMTIAAIEETERSTATDRMRIIQERAPVENEGGIGPGGFAFSKIITK